MEIFPMASTSHSNGKDESIDAQYQCSDQTKAGQDPGMNDVKGKSYLEALIGATNKQTSTTPPLPLSPSSLRLCSGHIEVYLVFITLISIDDKSKFEEGQIDNWSWLEKWFCKIEIRTPNSGIKARRCWLSCSGIPIHAWNMYSFYNIAQMCGDFIHLGNDTMKLESFERAAMLIIPSSLQTIDECIHLTLGIQIYLINVQEFSPDCVVHYPEWSQWKDYESSYDPSSDDGTSMAKAASPIGGVDEHNCNKLSDKAPWVMEVDIGPEILPSVLAITPFSSQLTKQLQNSTHFAI
ncbi:hypothetical protein QQP08_004764 [Theobroma cacao]|nr:hypothetical protein QQP08_004764 [Theobroma cacao]